MKFGRGVARWLAKMLESVRAFEIRSGRLQDARGTRQWAKSKVLVITSKAHGSKWCGSATPAASSALDCMEHQGANRKLGPVAHLSPWLRFRSLVHEQKPLGHCSRACLMFAAQEQSYTGEKLSSKSRRFRQMPKNYLLPGSFLHKPEVKQ